MNQETCAICLTNLNDSNKDEYILSCQHKFHSECIMDWFRSMNGNGNCPLCNDNPFSQKTDNNQFNFFSGLFIDERFKLVLKYSRKKNSPEKLKKEIENYKQIVDDYKKFKKDKSNYQKSEEVKNVQKKLRKYNTKDWQWKIKLNKKKNKIVALCPALYFY